MLVDKPTSHCHVASRMLETFTSKPLGCSQARLRENHVVPEEAGLGPGPWQLSHGYDPLVAHSVCLLGS